jgi:hypothetical protein
MSRRSRVLLALAAGWLGAACAEHAGGKAAEGALEKFREPPPEGTPRVAERLGREATEGALGELTSPEGLASISRILEETFTRSMQAALRAPGVRGRAGAGPGGSLVGRVSHDSAAAFGAGLSEELQRELGADGNGPLGASLGAVAAQVSSSAVQGARGELSGLLPECAGPDRRACLEAGARSLGRAAAVGFVEGVVDTVAWPVLGLVFLVGVFSVLLAQGASLVLRRRHPPSRREAHP